MLTRGTVGLVLGISCIFVAVVWKVVATRLASRITDRTKTAQKQTISSSERQHENRDETNSGASDGLQK